MCPPLTSLSLLLRAAILSLYELGEGQLQHKVDDSDYRWK